MRLKCYTDGNTDYTDWTDLHGYVIRVVSFFLKDQKEGGDKCCKERAKVIGSVNKKAPGIS
jgi:hypothetical protein